MQKNKPVYTVRESRVSDIAIIAQNMREADRKEIWRSSTHTPDSGVRTAFFSSEKSWTGCKDGVPFVMFGFACVSMTARVYNIWLLGTPEIERAGLVFLKKSRIFVDRMRKLAAVLENWVDSENAVSIKWLKWCGFTVEPAQPYGWLGRNFHYFYLKS